MTFADLTTGDSVFVDDNTLIYNCTIGTGPNYCCRQSADWAAHQRCRRGRPYAILRTVEDSKQRS